MTPEIVGIIGVVVVVVLMFSGMWIGIAMGIVGFLGYMYLEGTSRAFATLSTVTYSTVASYSLTAVPLFILMGAVIANSGMGSALYDTAYKWMGQFRGGLALATTVACAAFAAICGSSMAEVVTMGKVALPEMKKYNYDDSLATGCVAAGGTLGILIPPSLGFILYGIITTESISHLFMAGIIPGILLTVLFLFTIVIITIFRPMAAPPGPSSSFRDKIVSLKNIWFVVVLFIVVLGGIYLGIFTPTEAGAVGAFGAILASLPSGGLNRKVMYDSISDTGKLTAMLVILIVGAFIFMRFLTVSRVAYTLAEMVSGLLVSKYLIFGIIVLFYILLGMFLDISSATVVTLPFIYPVIVALGFDPIWFGVIVVILMEMGLVTPPFGMNVFLLAGVTKVPMNIIFQGAWPFVFAMLLCVIILTIFPQIVLFLPSLM